MKICTKRNIIPTLDDVNVFNKKHSDKKLVCILAPTLSLWEVEGDEYGPRSFAALSSPCLACALMELVDRDPHKKDLSTIHWIVKSPWEKLGFQVLVG